MPTQRLFDGSYIPTNEDQDECRLHYGAWDTRHNVCVFEDAIRYEMYLEHVRVEPNKEGDVGYTTDERYEPLDEQEEQIRLTYTGLAPDAPIDTNEHGGQQSKIEGRFDLIPPIAMLELAKIMEYGAKRYAPNNWRKIPLDDHVNHMLMHLFAYVAGDRQDDHLGHALARAAMAVEIAKLGEQEKAA
jgi:hypothetical protein